MPTKHTFLELCGKYLKSWYISGGFDVHFENLSGLWRLTEHLNGPSVESSRCLWWWTALFYFVMNRAMNFVGSIFKVIWLHIHSQGNASFTSVNADNPPEQKGKQDAPVASFYFGASLSSKCWMRTCNKHPRARVSFLRLLNLDRGFRKRGKVEVKGTRMEKREELKRSREKLCFSHLWVASLFSVAWDLPCSGCRAGL